MHYYIDGYNLLFHLFGTESNDLQSQRVRLIENLNLKIEFLGLDISIVFDSHYCPGQGSRSHYHHLEILYTPQNVTADDYIIQHIKNSRSATKEILVTNDKELSARARELYATTQSLEHFLNWLNRRYSNQKSGKVKPEAPVHIRPKLLPLATAPSASSSAPPLETLKSSPPAGSVDYYLAKFEASYLENVKQREIVKAEKSAKKGPKRRPQTKESLFPSIEENTSARYSEFERWLEIFEKRSKL